MTSKARNEGSPQTPGSACGLCGSYSLTDLGHGHGNGTVICNTCGAHWWKRWYARKEWEAWINEPNDQANGRETAKDKT